MAIGNEQSNLTICISSKEALAGRGYIGICRQTDLNQNVSCASNYKYFIKNQERSEEARFSHLVLASETQAFAII